MFLEISSLKSICSWDRMLCRNKPFWASYGRFSKSICFYKIFASFTHDLMSFSITLSPLRPCLLLKFPAMLKLCGAEQDSSEILIESWFGSLFGADIWQLRCSSQFWWDSANEKTWVVEQLQNIFHRYQLVRLQAGSSYGAVVAQQIANLLVLSSNLSASSPLLFCILGR